VPSLLKASILPLTKEKLASQECVGRNAKRYALALDRPAELGTDPSRNRPVEKGSSDVEVCLLTVSLELQVPIKMVDGHPWSPGVHQSLCLLGQTLEVAWVRAFI
jgi:hypothetical protein